MAEYTINKIKFGNNTYNLSADIPDLSGTYMPFMAPTAIEENTDISTIRTPGTYYANSTVAPTCTGTPQDGAGTSFKLTVEKTYINSSYAQQHLYYYDTGQVWTQILSSSAISKHWYPADSRVHALADSPNIDNTMTLLQVLQNTPRYAVVDIGWIGTSGGNIASDSTLANDMPEAYGHLYAVSAAGNNPVFAWFYSYSTGNVYVRVYDTTNATHDSGWNLVPSKTTVGAISARSISDVAQCTIGSNCNLRKYGTHVDCNFDITLAVSNSTGSSNYFATVPTDYRPASTFVGVASSGTGTLCLVTITTGGNVYQLTGTLAANTRIRGSFSWSTA